jgi:hypothetical protein
MPRSSRQTAVTLPRHVRALDDAQAHSVYALVEGHRSHSGSLGRVNTLGKIEPMALVFVHNKCQH